MIRKINDLIQAWYPQQTADEIAQTELREARIELLAMQTKVEESKLAVASNQARLDMYVDRVARLENRTMDGQRVWSNRKVES